MSDITSGRIASHRISLRSRLASILGAMGHAFALYMSRRDLAELDDRMLKDLGISRAQAQFEASRPVWQDDPLPRR
jgi:uncharacterized protein YjiS (DUF1127 family)